MLFLFMDGRKTVGAGLQHFVSTDVVCCCQDPSFCCDRCVFPWQKAVFLQCFPNRLFRLQSPGLLAPPYPCSQKADMRLKHCLDELQDLGCGLCFDRWFGVKAYILALFPKDVSASQGSCEVSVPLTPWCWQQKLLAQSKICAFVWFWNNQLVSFDFLVHSIYQTSLTLRKMMEFHTLCLQIKGLSLYQGLSPFVKPPVFLT